MQVNHVTSYNPNFTGNGQRYIQVGSKFVPIHLASARPAPEPPKTFLGKFLRKVTNDIMYIFHSKGDLKKLTDPMIKVTKTQDSIILTNKYNGIKLEVQTFTEKEIKKLQDIADKIRESKRH